MSELRCPSANARLWGAAAIVAAAAIAIAVREAILGSSGTWLFTDADVHFLVMSAAVVSVCILAARRSAGPARRAWFLLGTMAALNLLADVGWVTLDVLGESPYLSVFDALYFLAYLPLLVAFILVARARDAGRGSASVVDGMAVAAGMGLLVWQMVVVAPGGLDAASGVLQRVVLVSYPVLDLLVIGAAVGLLLASGRRVVSLWLLLLYAALFMAADVAYSTNVDGSRRLENWSDLLYVLSYVALVSAALHPSAPRIADPEDRRDHGTTRYFLLGAALIVPPVTAAVSIVVLGSVETVVFVACSVVLALVLMARIAGALRSEKASRADAVAVEQELARLALTDEVTGLPNRNALIECLGEHAAEDLALLFLDLDRFKIVNDTAGHAAGDLVLARAGERISRSVREEDQVFRLAGDEYVALCVGMTEGADLDLVAERILAALAEPFREGDFEWYLGASVGIAWSSASQPVEPSALLRNADLAMYEAKRSGRNLIRRFDSEMRTSMSARLDTERALRRALDREELEAAVQPIVELAGGGVVGFEALARWPGHRGSGGDTAHFIDAAEQAGLVTRVDHFMLRRACAFIGSYNDKRLDRAPAWISVNMSPVELAAGDLTARVEATVLESGIDPNWLVLELTEGALNVDVDLARRRLTELAELGVRIAVDDFGTGFSSLAHLLRFPVDLLKVDRIFVEDLSLTGNRRSVAAAVLKVAETLSIPAIAEGVETEVQALALRELGYGLAQGFLFGRPMSPAEALRSVGAHADGRSPHARSARPGRAVT